MHAAMFTGPKEIGVIDFHLPDLSHNELLIKVGACGICGTDFHIFNGTAPAKPPIILGHEYAGEVISIGNRVKGFEVGERVAIDPNIFCGYCKFCRSGKIQLCENLTALGVSENGGLSEFAIIPVSQAYKIPNDFSYRKAAFAEPLSCCLHGIDQANIKVGDNVAIIGAGSIGLLMLQLAKLSGVSKIIVTEPLESKRKVAEKLGADYVLDSKDASTHKNIDDLTSGGADNVIECAGTNDSAEFALSITKKGGTLVIFGLAAFQSFLSINLQQIFQKEITIKTSLLNPFSFQRAVDLLVSDKIDVDQLNLTTYPLETDSLRSVFTEPRSDSVIKYMIELSN